MAAALALGAALGLAALQGLTASGRGVEAAELPWAASFRAARDAARARGHLLLLKPLGERGGSASSW